MPLDPALDERRRSASSRPTSASSRGETAAGILRITNAKIAGAVRVISIERGYHPKDFSILGFGGAGAFVAAEVAPRARRSRRRSSSAGPATFSAFGMLMADVVNDFWPDRDHAARGVDIESVERRLRTPCSAGAAALAGRRFPERDRRSSRRRRCATRARSTRSTSRSRAHELEREETAPTILEQFGAAHHQQYGHSMDDPVEIVTLRLRAVGVLPRPEIPKIEAGDGDASGARAGRRSVYRAEETRRLGRLRGVRPRQAPRVGLPRGAGDHRGAELDDRDPRRRRLTVGEHGELIIRWV